MECAVSLDETSRNLLMLIAWLPSLLAAATVFLLSLRSRRVTAGVRRTLLALLAGFLTLFGTWIGLMLVGGHVVC